jgi:hypothetical protein
MRRESKGPLMIDRGEVLERVVRACTLSYKKEKLKADCMPVTQLDLVHCATVQQGTPRVIERD